MDQTGTRRCCLLLMWIVFPWFPWDVMACKDIVLSPLHEGAEVGIELLAQDPLFSPTGKLISYHVAVVYLNTEHNCILSYSGQKIFFLIYDKS